MKKRYNIFFEKIGLEEEMILYLLQRGFTVHAKKTYDVYREPIESLSQLPELRIDGYIVISASLQTMNAPAILDELCSRFTPSTISATRCD